MYREGKLYTQKVIEVIDHDFHYLADGIIIPHGIYDYFLNIGYITIGTSHETSEFICDCIFDWWQVYGQNNYSNPSSILLLCDSGGSNNARHYIFKENLEQLVNKIGIEIRVAHYPPYTSRFNPIEHRLFPHITRVCQGVIFQDVKMVKSLMQKTATKTGLKVFVSTNDKIYETGKEVSKGYKNNMAIIFDRYLPQWNYTAVPSSKKISYFHHCTFVRDKSWQIQESLKRTQLTLQQVFPDIR